jgi:hypothetical protein
MIINSIIAGGGSQSEYETYFRDYDSTQTMTVSQLFTNLDIRLKYRNSILWVFAHQGTNTTSATGVMTLLMIVNRINFSTQSGFNEIYLYRTGSQGYFWGASTYSTRELIDQSYFSADATTGRISCTSTVSYPIALNGSKIAVWETPISYESGKYGIDTTPWGS